MKRLANEKKPIPVMVAPLSATAGIELRSAWSTWVAQVVVRAAVAELDRRDQKVNLCRAETTPLSLRESL
jgi:hypothetical protein